MTQNAACLLATTLALLGATAAEAANPRIANQRVAALDTNGDGQISREEAAANPQLAGQFDAVDTNRDGVLSSAELKAFGKSHKNRALQQMDTNGDGVLTREEAAKNRRLMANWDSIDTNKDGRLSSDELRAYKQSTGAKAMPATPMPPATTSQ